MATVGPPIASSAITTPAKTLGAAECPLPIGDTSESAPTARWHGSARDAIGRTLVPACSVCASGTTSTLVVARCASILYLDQVEQGLLKQVLVEVVEARAVPAADSDLTSGTVCPVDSCSASGYVRRAGIDSASGTQQVPYPPYAPALQQVRYAQQVPVQHQVPYAQQAPYPSQPSLISQPPLSYLQQTPAAAAAENPLQVVSQPPSGPCQVHFLRIIQQELNNLGLSGYAHVLSSAGITGSGGTACCTGR
ncbi:hypothetical protein C6341_g5621 [Phytophthora cactorum]|nr:hypothetical protein C6341_g5621 [Phytophthora cactorum]